MLTQKIKELRYCDYVEQFVNNNKPIEAFHSEIKNQFDNENVPISKQGLINLALQKNDSLKRYLDINLSKIIIIDDVAQWREMTTKAERQRMRLFLELENIKNIPNERIVDF